MAFQPNTKGPQYKEKTETYYIHGRRKQRTVVRMLCECSNHAERVTGDLVYPERPELYRKLFFLCLRCNRYVGCHAGSGIPMGTLANQEVRRLRATAHQWFDRLWRDHGYTRGAAYHAMKVAVGVRHIGWEQEEGCKAVTEWAKAEIVRCQMKEPA